jgi:hypothetical protein
LRFWYMYRNRAGVWLRSSSRGVFSQLNGMQSHWCRCGM